MPFDAFFLAGSGKKRMFFLPRLKKRRKSVFCAIKIFAHFALLTLLFNDCPNNDDRKEQHHDAGRHRKGDRNADNKDQSANDAATNKGDEAAQHDDGKQSGEQDGGDLVHGVQFKKSVQTRQE
jgi:hypothetical protein